MKILNVKQGTEEWLDARLGLVTASELDALISPTWKIKTGDGPRTYLYRKVAEAWLCKTIYGGGAFAMEQGTLLEPEARPWYELTYDCEVKTAGFIVGDDNRCGCSPDGLIAGEKRGLELKCPQEIAAVRYAIEGEFPEQYQMQVHGSMFVTGYDQWTFLSYHRTLPKFVITIQRREDRMETIQQALSEFYDRFDEAFERLNKSADEPRKNPFLL